MLLQASEELRLVLTVPVDGPGTGVSVQARQLAVVRLRYVAAFPRRVQPLYLGICTRGDTTSLSRQFIARASEFGVTEHRTEVSVENATDFRFSLPKNSRTKTDDFEGPKRSFCRDGI